MFAVGLMWPPGAVVFWHFDLSKGAVGSVTALLSVTAFWKVMITTSTTKL